MVERKFLWILPAVLAVTLGTCPAARAQTDPVLAGSSSAKSSAAVSSLTLTAPTGLFPGNLMIANLSQSYGSGPTVVSLSSVANKAPFASSGTAPTNSGFDTQGYAFATNLVGTSLSWNGATYPLCGANTVCAAQAVTVTLPAGNYTTLNLLASNWNPGQSMTFTLTYTDNSTTSLTQSFSNWGYPQSYAGETTVLSTAYRIMPSGATQAGPWYLFGYTFSLNSAKTVKSITIPNTGVVVFGMSLSVSNAGATAPSGWTQMSENWTGAVSQSIFYRIATSADVAGTTAYQFSFPTGGLASGSIMAFGGVATTSPNFTTASQLNAASTTITAPAVTYDATQTWVGIYTIANGTTSGSDFNTLGSSTTIIDAGTGSGTSGVLIGGFDWQLSGSCSNSPCSSATFSGTTKTGVSAGSIGTSILLTGATPSPSALWHFDQTSWSGTPGEATDSSGNAYNGAAVGGATTAGTIPAISGSPGTCYYAALNGSSQYVQLPSTFPHIGNNATITAWIRPTATPASGYGARVFWDDFNYNGYAFSFGDPGSNKMSLWVRNPAATVNSSYGLTLNTWYFVAADFQISGGYFYLFLFIFDASGNQLDAQGKSVSGTWSAGTGAYATIGGNATGSVEGPYSRFPGNIDEVTVYDVGLTYAQVAALAQATHPCSLSAPNHYAVSAASSAVNCQATPVTISAHTSAHALIATTDTITLSTTTGHGDWTLSSGVGSFTAGTANSGAATYTYAQADGGSAIFGLRDTVPEAVTINVSDGSITASSSEDNPITFAPSGFRITNGSNAATSINTQVAGVTSTQSLALQPIRTDTSTGACTAAFASSTTVSVGLAYQCNNPTSCVGGQTFLLTNNGTTTNIAANGNSGVTNYTSVPLKFSTANAEAPFTLTYSDVGQISFAAKYNIPLQGGGASANNMVGSSQFVVQPFALKLSNIKATASGTPNPAASSASGTVFLGAGQSFTATVTANNYAGNATPNFGQETSPATVTLTSALVLPTSGHNPSVSGSFGTFASGAATGTGFSWPEVGIMTVTPSVASFLGSGSISGTNSGNVGRFVPNAFTTALNTPVFAPACTAGGYTYLGQSFNYSVAPVITATAVALGGAITQNYGGAFMRMTAASLTGRTYIPTPASPALTLTGLPSSASDPTIADLGTGQVTLTFSSGSGLAFARGTATVPFNANIALSENVIDADGVTATNPVTFGAGSGISFTTSTSAQQLYGRLWLPNATGSELLDLPMTLATQYYYNTSVGFVANTLDSCTSAPAIAFSNYQQNLASGNICVRDSGSPGVSGQGCAASASSRYAPTAGAGAFNLIFAAPGSGHNGAVSVTATAPAWLQYLWSVSSGSNSSPTGLAMFGLFPGSPTRVYQREIY